MRIALEIFLGLLYVSFLIACCRYFWKDNSLKQYEEYLNSLLARKPTE